MKTKWWKMAIPGSLMIPLFATACSTTWINWKKGDDLETTFEFKKKEQKYPKEKYQVRELTTLKKAYNFENQTLNLNLVNNHYEFLTLMGYITNLKAKAPIDSFWKQQDWLNNLYSQDQTRGFFDEIIKKIELNLKFNDQEYQIKYDLTDVLHTIHQGFKEYKSNQDKAFDVENNGGINEKGITKQLLNVQKVGLKMTKIPIVQSLLNYDSFFALQLGKLVNLPKKTFDNFVELLKKLNNFVDQIWTNSLFNNWINEKNVNLRIEKDGQEFARPLINPKTIFQAKFVANILK